MNKLKTVFQRSQKPKTEDNRRSQQFVKRHSSINAVMTVSPINTKMATSQALDTTLSIHFSDLSESEKPAYEAWWKDLDPFDLQKINSQTILKFLDGCELQDDKLERILTLFDPADDGLNKFQFFAMLRLIAHAQNGRKISPALVYLGAPIPRFRTNATIDALIKSDLPQRQLALTYYENRKSWWEGYEKSQMENRRSYIGPFTTHTPIPNTFIYHHHQQQQQLALDYNHEQTIALPTTERQPMNSHSRSRSAGTANEFIQSFISNHQEQQEEEGTDSENNLILLQSSKSSLSLNELTSSSSNGNNGKSLLLTQKFVYQSPSIRHQDVLSISTNNPFHNITQQQQQEEELKSPFDDDLQDSINSVFSVNQKPNKYAIPPPPVPDQSTKPAFPKYARTKTRPSSMIKRSQTTKINRTEQYPAFYNKHQRHKSTNNIVLL
ncbi:MAG: hypothetical protein EXX96DRAFT_472393 [Benjaminiella poitrasii]|nr:MAG: hypothetical protein EXX96DRAFT_472393 [Benjaminiella poitrasii]